MRTQTKRLRSFLNKWSKLVNSKKRMITKDIHKDNNKILKEAKWKIQINKYLMKKPIFKINMKNNESLYNLLYI